MMHCPKCQHAGYSPDKPCLNCNFSGDAALIEELAHIAWLLNELESGEKFPIAAETQEQVRVYFETRKQNLEIALGLRLPALTAEEAQQAWVKLTRYEILDQKFKEWLEAGDIDPLTVNYLAKQLAERISKLNEQLEGYPQPEQPPKDSDLLKTWQYILEVVDRLSLRRAFTNPAAEIEYRKFLQTEIENLEISLGLRLRPVPVEEAEEVQAPTPEPSILEIHPPSPEPAAAKPKVPLRERLWNTLLSERTLQAILFLGIFLLFTAAISFVIWGWQDFSAPVRVAIPTAFTLLFFGLGWFVRKKTTLYRSGIALSAIAALLIPIDLYMVYQNFGNSPAYWAEFWLIASVICLFLYILVTLSIQNRFFGYLVGVAAGSVVLAGIEVGHKTLGLSQDWRSAGLSLLALVLLLVATALTRLPAANQWRVFTDPLRYLALLSVGAIMPLTLGWRYLDRESFDTLHTALAINWWIGGFIFGWGAVQYRSRGLGLLAILSLPVAVYLTQAGIFYKTDINPAWQAFGLACLVPLYFWAGFRFSKRKDDPVLQSHGRSAIGSGLALLILSALWSLTDLTSGTAAASSHAVLAGSVVLAAILWQKPAYLYGASFLSFTTLTFAMTELGIALEQSSVGWASLALLHILFAIYVGKRSDNTDQRFAPPLVIAAYIIAGLAVIAPLFPYDQSVLIYTLGNWLGLTGWGIYLAQKKQPGFVPQRERWQTLFHWGASLPLPVWIWLLFVDRRPPDFSLALGLSVLSWGMYALSLWLARLHPDYRRPWRLTSLIVSIVAPTVAFWFAYDGFTPAICLLAAGLMYFADTLTLRQARGFIPAGLVTAWGYSLLWIRFELSTAAIVFALSALVAIYFLGGLWAERRYSSSTMRPFLTPLYAVGHGLALLTVFLVYLFPLDDFFGGDSWTDAVRLWGAATQILLAGVYLLYAWGSYREFWGYIGIWLLTAGGGFIIIAFSSGRGRSAAWAALGAIALVLSERTLRWLYRDSKVALRTRAFLRLAWRLYRNPLLVTGWMVSVGAILLALIRNLVILGGGRTQQFWAVVGLSLITGLFALSARLFRQVRFVWLVGALSFIPWTILSNLGWFTAYRFTEAGFAVSWMILAWLIFLVNLLVKRQTPKYAFPLEVISNLLVAFALLWGLEDSLTSRYTFGLAIALYVFAVWLDHRYASEMRGETSEWRTTKYLYPALGLIPVWCLYWLGWMLPSTRDEHFGLLLLCFGPLGLVTGQWLKNRAPKEDFAHWYGFPAYLTGYVSIAIGTVLVSHKPALLSMILLYDALLMVVSTWYFKNALWIYPAAVIVPFALWIALDVRAININRRGWGLIGLAAIYLSQAWMLKRARLNKYSNNILVVGLLLILAGLPPSGGDEVGAFWGYGGAVLLYTLTAFWLRRPLLLSLACLLSVVPYAVGVRQLGVDPDFYGLALFPGAAVSLALGWWLDRRFGSWDDFPWEDLTSWPKAFLERIWNWWALPLYALGFGFALVSPIFTGGRSELIALNFALSIPIFGWAINRFRLRIWLVGLTLAAHLAWGFMLDGLGWWGYPAYAWQRYAPVTITTLLAALWVQGHLGEESPLKSRSGWSHIIYTFLLIDILLSQLMSLGGTGAGALVSLINALIVAVLASAWRSQFFTYLGTALGAIALSQWLSSFDRQIEELPAAFAYLSLGYCIAGYLLTMIHRRSEDTGESKIPVWLLIWESPFQISGLVLSFGVLVLSFILGFDLVTWTVRALVGIPFRQIVDLTTVRMVVQVLSVLGLLYLTTALVYRQMRLSYLAFGMLLSGWMIYIFYIQQLDNLSRLHWYSLPTGLYLLGVAYLEWNHGNRGLARWLDYTAIGLVLGSLFWQTLVFGWSFALLMGGVSLMVMWWGSARRLRRFFYAGILGVVLATLGQLLNALQHINQWITFGIIGILLVVVAVIVERRLESFKAWQDTLEDWE